MPPRGMTPRQHGHARMIRPRTSPGFLSRSGRGLGSIHGALNPEDRAIPEEDEEVDGEDIELLEYEWPDLPPIPCMKDAVSRKRVSQGISYLLPVDKGKNSINNKFRTDLRAMFQEPYASDSLQYDDNRVKLSAEVHFLSNSADTKWTPQHLTSIPTNLNADSERARKLYVHSAPTGGVAGRRMGIDPSKLRKRSNLFLPVKASKAQVSPEIVKLREEATHIIKQGMTYDEEGDKLSQRDNQEHAGTTNVAAKTVRNGGLRNGTQMDSHNLGNSTQSFSNGFSQRADAGNRTLTRQNTTTKNTHNNGYNNNINNNGYNNNTNNNGYNNKTKNNVNGGEDHHGNQQISNGINRKSSVGGGGNDNNMLTTFGGSYLQESLGTSVLNDKLDKLSIHHQGFSNYEDFRNSSPPKLVIPRELSSPYLDEKGNQRVWEWLHYGESMNDFEYFLSVCG